MCVVQAEINRFYPSTPSTTSVRAASPILESYNFCGQAVSYVSEDFENPKTYPQLLCVFLYVHFRPGVEPNQALSSQNILAVFLGEVSRPVFLLSRGVVRDFRMYVVFLQSKNPTINRRFQVYVDVSAEKIAPFQINRVRN